MREIFRVPPEAVNLAQTHIGDILEVVFEYDAVQADAVVVFDAECDLTRTLTEAYRKCLPNAKFIDFGQVSPVAVRASFQSLKPLDLVVLIQSTNFRLNEFRIRVELFNRSLKVIEHPHLSRMQGKEALYYIDSLAYDPRYYRNIGQALKSRIDQASSCVVESGGGELIFSGGFERAKLNVGDYSGMKNIGGQFPIGEVFTEAKDLESVNGSVSVFAFGDASFKVNKPAKLIKVEVVRGRVAGAIDSTPEFEEVLRNIRNDEGEIWVRELGFGLNRSFTRERLVSDIGTYERMCGVHLSLGAKHTIYKKPAFNISQKIARHHVDIFADTHSVKLDGGGVYHEGCWRV